MEEWGVFTAADASRAVGLSRRQVLLLVEQGLVVPSHPSAGRGNARRFSFIDLVRCAIAKDLGQHLGMAPRFVKTIMSQLPDSRLRGRPNNAPDPICIIVGVQGQPSVLSIEEMSMDALGQSTSTTTLVVNLNLIQRDLKRILDEAQ
jgi:DNA-binding transcriptional MerR regulator